MAKLDITTIAQFKIIRVSQVYFTHEGKLQVDSSKINVDFESDKTRFSLDVPAENAPMLWLGRTILLGVEE